MSSTRLPGKVLLSLAGKPVLSHVFERVQRAKGLDIVIVATSTDADDVAIATLCATSGYSCFRGSHNDVLSRYFEAARQFKLDVIVRITCDNPFVDPGIISEVITAYQSAQCDYISNVLPGERMYPRGLDVEVFSFNVLKTAHAKARETYEREHVTPYIHENKTGEFRIGKMVEARGLYRRPQYRLALDYPEDYALISYLYERFYTPGNVVSVTDVVAFLDEHPDIAARNAMRETEYPRHGIRK